jgi:hypothetical protein
MRIQVKELRDSHNLLIFITFKEKAGADNGQALNQAFCKGPDIFME